MHNQTSSEPTNKAHVGPPPRREVERNGVMYKVVPPPLTSLGQSAVVALADNSAVQVKLSQAWHLQGSKESRQKLQGNAGPIVASLKCDVTLTTPSQAEWIMSQ
eukprot:357753-Chlamydomonas_euryale.AAC.1